jgi:transglutaminase-like putative cysteine protease
MNSKQIFKKGICLTMASVLLLTGCSPSNAINENTASIDEVQEEQTNLSKTTLAEGDDELLATLRAKYGAANVEYSKETISLDRNQPLQFELGFDSLENDISDWGDYFTIYQDSDMKYPITDIFFDYDYTKNTITIEPPTFGVMEPMLPSGSELDISDLSGNYLDNDETCDNWGNLDKLYLAQKIDIETSEELATPKVTIINLNSELKNAPKVTYSCNEYGDAQISWTPVEGATDYLLFTVMKTEDGFNSYSYIFARTTETSWTAPKESMEDGTTYRMNSNFENYITSEDQMVSGGFEDMNEDFFETMPEYVGVIAVNKTGSSPVSNLISLKDYSKLLPNTFAHYENAAENDSLFRTSVDLLPAEISITMCDGTTARRVIDYDFETATLDNEFSQSYLNIWGYASGSRLCDEYMVVVNEETLEADLAALKERQEKLKNKGGTINKDITINDEQSPEPTSKPEEETKPTETVEPSETTNTDVNTEVKVTANSALSEYIAIYMLNSAEAIDLSMFNESVNTDIVADAFLEAQYQNPLVMGVQGASYDTENSILYVTYDDSPEETSAKREETKQKASEVVSQIITDDMSDLEKEIAINQYLCDNAVYDDAALENAEQYEFQYVDDEFLDSFTPYGTLVNGVGVCASYAGAFKVLADEAGLESIVVTGYLEGNLPHAWNRVKIDDQWISLDSTNNDNEVVQNVLMNVSDSGVSDVLVEDERFVIDEKLYDYTCDTDDNEFYHYNNKYYDLDTISNKLAEELSTNDNAMLRTDYMINDAEFQTIAQNVANQVGGEIKGYYWLGVIHLTR